MHSTTSTCSRFMQCCIAALYAVAPSLTGCDSHPAAQASTVSSPVPAASARPEPSDPAPKQIDPASYTTTGPLVAEQQADIASERDGRVVNIAVEIGDHVKRGQLLASLDDRPLKAAVESQSARIASLRAQVLEWEAEEKMDDADLRRADRMRAEKILSEENWEHVKYKLDEVTAEVSRYRSDEIAAEADLRAAKLQLEQCHVVAPFDGVVGRQSLRLTQEVKKGDVLFWITAEGPLRVLFTVPESAMPAFSVGTSLDLTNASYPDLHQPASILRVSPVVDPASDSVQVVGSLTHPSHLLKPGMSMQVAVLADGDTMSHKRATR